MNEADKCVARCVKKDKKFCRVHIIYFWYPFLFNMCCWWGKTTTSRRRGAVTPCFNVWGLIIVIFFISVLIYFATTTSYFEQPLLQASAFQGPIATPGCVVCDEHGPYSVIPCCPVLHRYNHPPPDTMMYPPSYSALALPPDAFSYSDDPSSSWAMMTEEDSHFANMATCDDQGQCYSSSHSTSPSLSMAATVPHDFFKVDYQNAEVKCTGQIPDECRQTGMYAFLRSPRDQYKDYSLRGVYGGKYCRATCEAKMDHKVCMCTEPPQFVEMSLF
jgi:hypothetical protein